MINLRYHIVSLTAVFLAIGIGLTLGSTFLDRATVENLNGQLENLEGRLADRQAQANELNAQISETEELRTALDEQGSRLLENQLVDVPVVVVTSRGVDTADIEASVQALVSAGADVQGLWWFTDRWTLDDDSEVDDLGGVLEASSTDPSRLRRMAIDSLGGELRDRQVLAPDGGDSPADGDPGAAPAAQPGAEIGGTTPTSVGPTEGADDRSDAGPSIDGEVEILTALSETGFIEFDAVAGGPETARFPDGTRIVVVGGSPEVPDDLVVAPLLGRMARSSTTPILGVASSALDSEDEISDLVEVVRADEHLRELLPTVDHLNHFEGWAAMVIALADVADGVVGHYGLAEDAATLIPPIRAP